MNGAVQLRKHQRHHQQESGWGLEGGGRVKLKRQWKKADLNLFLNNLK